MRTNTLFNKDEELTDTDLNELLMNSHVRRIIIEDSNKFEGPLTYKDASLILKAMSNNRSPRSDGFGAEVF